MKNVGSVIMDADDDDPPEDRDEEDKAALELISSSSLMDSRVEKSASDFCANLWVEDRLLAA